METTEDHRSSFHVRKNFDISLTLYYLLQMRSLLTQQDLTGNRQLHQLVLMSYKTTALLVEEWFAFFQSILSFFVHKSQCKLKIHGYSRKLWRICSAPLAKSGMKTCICIWNGNPTGAALQSIFSKTDIPFSASSFQKLLVHLEICLGPLLCNLINSGVNTVLNPFNNSWWSFWSAN